MYKNLKVVTLASVILAALSAPVMAEESAANAPAVQKAAKPLSCKQQANQAGIKDKEQRKTFIKDCKAKAKAGKDSK